MVFARHGRYYHGFAFGQDCSGGGGLRIAGSQMTRLGGFCQVAAQQALGVGRSYPSPFLGDTDGHNVVFLLIDGVQDRGCRQQRDFMLATAPAKQDTYPEFCHASILTPERFVNSRSEEHTSELQSRQYLVCRL